MFFVIIAHFSVSRRGVSRVGTRNIDSVTRDLKNNVDPPMLTRLQKPFDSKFGTNLAADTAAQNPSPHIGSGQTSGLNSGGKNVAPVSKLKGPVLDRSQKNVLHS